MTVEAGAGTGETGQTGTPTTHGRWSRAWPVLVAIAPFVAFGVLVVVNLRVDHPLGGDQGALELWTRSALHGTARLGPYSRFGWNHPGPAAFYAFAPWYALAGQRPGGIALGALVVNVACSATIVWSIRRHVGTTAAHLAAATTLAWLVIAGITWFDEPWNPVLVVLPLALAGVAAAHVVSGRTGMLAVVAASTSFAVQSHVGTVPMAASCAALAVGAIVVEGVRRRPLPWRDLAIAAVVSATLWILPVVQQLTGQPGNLRLLATFFRSSSGHQPPSAVLDASVASLGWTGTDLVHRALYPPLLPAASWWRLGWVAALVLVAAIGGLLAQSEGRRFEPALALVALASVAAVLVGLARVDGALEEYLALPALAAGLLLVLTVVLTVAALAATRATTNQRRVVRSSAPLASTTLAAALVVAMLATHPSRDLYVRMPTPASATTLAHVRAAIGDARSVNLEIATHEAWPEAVLVADQLERQGMDVRVSPDWRFMFGEQRTGLRCPAPALIVARGEHDEDRPPGEVAGRIGATTVLVDPAGGTACASS